MDISGQIAGTDLMPTLIMGVDPGSLITGFGLVSAEGDRLRHVAHGVIDARKGKSQSQGEGERVGAENVELLQRLPLIGRGFRELLLKYQPNAVVIESIFLGKNPDSAFKLGHARGVLAYEAGLQDIPIFEYATRLVKKGLTGKGSADKTQVEFFVRHLLRLQEIRPLDASDALAMACHHAITGRRATLFANAREL